MVNLNATGNVNKFSKKEMMYLEEWEIFPIPIIAVINGFTLGGGCELAMSCDIRLCSENSIFGQPEVGLGITPGFGGVKDSLELLDLEEQKKWFIRQMQLKLIKHMK